MAMQPLPPKDEATLPTDGRNIEPDVGPMAPGETPSGLTTPKDGMDPMMEQEEQGIPVEEIEAYFNGLPEQSMAYLAEHMTPEIINVIRIVSGKEVGDYLNQFADNDKVLVPVPRQMAEEYRQQAMSQSQPQQGPAPTPQPQAQPAPRPQGMMSPAV